MSINDFAEINRTQLAAVAHRYGARRVALFGSALRDELSSDSDIDLLVEFEPDQIPGMLRIAQFELELSRLFGGRQIDVRTYEDLSIYFRDEVRSKARSLYEAA